MLDGSTGPGREPAVPVERFGQLPDGRPVHRHTLDNGAGIVMQVLDFGAIVTSLRVPDRHGTAADVVLGHDTLPPYLDGHLYLGALVGRYANRIAGARFVIDGVTHRLDANEDRTTLHGGHVGFGRRLWRAVPAPAQPDAVALDLFLTSPDGEGGFPGTLDLRLRYTLTRRGEWIIDTRATTDRPTVLNLTQHSYFNLAGGGTALDHELTILAPDYLPVAPGLLPLQPAPVDGTAFDFRSARRVGDGARQAHPQLSQAGGYDHSWVLSSTRRDVPALAARLVHRPSGRRMEVFTTQPALQFYAGNFIDARHPGRAGVAWQPGDGLCLEAQQFPDAPNRPDFPSSVLRPGEIDRTRTVYRFSAG